MENLNHLKHALKVFVEDVLKHILDEGIERKVEVASTTKKIIVYIDVPARERGRVIGKKGITIEAIRLLAVGIKNCKFPSDKKVEIEVVEPEANFIRNKE